MSNYEDFVNKTYYDSALICLNGHIVNEVMQLNFVVRQGNSAITLSFVNPSPMGEGFQLLETLLQLHKLCSYIICSIKYTCTIYQFTQKIPHTLVLSYSRVVVLSIALKIFQEWEVSPCLQPVEDAGLPPPPLC